jgi:AraC-like DNA-binding protein
MANAIVVHESGFSGRTARAETFQDIIGNLVRPAQVRAERSARYDFRLNHVRFERLEVTTLSYGDPVEIDLHEIGDGAGESLVLQLVLSGSSCTYFDGASPVQHGRASAHLSVADQPMRVRCQRDCRHFLVRLDRGALQQTASDCRQRVELPDPRHSLSLVSPAGKALRRYMRYLVAELDRGSCDEFLRFASRATEQLLLVHILTVLQTPAGVWGTASRPGRRSTGIPTYVERAEAFIDAHLGMDIGIQDIVASTGTSLRTLYRGFERSRGTSPMEFLRERRLERAHAELVASDPLEVRVTDVALRWGFQHLSDFASRYRERFGCLPSETLRRH